MHQANIFSTNFQIIFFLNTNCKRLKKTQNIPFIWFYSVIYIKQLIGLWAKCFELCIQSALVWICSSDFINQNSPLGCMHQNKKKNEQSIKMRKKKKYPLHCQIVIYDDINHLEQCFMENILGIAFRVHFVPLPIIEKTYTDKTSIFEQMPRTANSS